MDFKLTPEQLAVQKSIREFVNKEVKPIAMERDQMADHENIFPIEAFKKSFEIGIHDCMIPTEYGGQGYDSVTLSLIWEEMAAADAGFCISYQGHFISVESISNHGTEEQRETFMKALCGEDGGLAALAGTESNFGPCWALLGEDRLLETRIKEDGDDYILNGVKTFCTNGGSPLTKWYTVMAQLGEDQSGMEPMRFCLVWADSPGISVLKSENKMGQRLSKNSQVYFDNVRIPKKYVYGPMTMESIVSSRNRKVKCSGMVLLGSLCVGLARSAYEEAFKYAKERDVGGKPAIQHPIIGAKLAEMYWNIEAVRSFIWNIAYSFDTDPIPNNKLAYGAKVLGSDLAVKVTNEALQIHGGFGYTKEALVEKLYRDAKVTQIYECPNDLLRVASSMLLDMGL